MLVADSRLRNCKSLTAKLRLFHLDGKYTI